MPEKCEIVSIFVALPSNLMEYFSKIDDIVDNFNEIHGFENGVIFRTLNWKKNVVSQVAPDAQTAVNDQVLINYDLLIAIIGDQLGRPTARAPSGTAEEIRNAIRKSDDIFGGRHVQVIFKNIKSSIKDIDVDEISRIRKFREEIYKEVFATEFDEDVELDGIVNRFLSNAMSSIKSFNKIESKTNNNSEIKY